jgi:hypothetical protein
LLFFKLKAETKEKLKNHQPLSPNFALINWSTLSQTRNGATNPLTLPLTADLGSVILRHVGLISPTVKTTLCKIKDGCVGLICPTCNAQRSVQRLGGKSGGTLHAHLEPLQVEF